MLINIFLNCTAMLLLSSLAWAADPPPSDVLIQTGEPNDVLIENGNATQPLPKLEWNEQTNRLRVSLIGDAVPPGAQGMQSVVRIQKLGDYWLGIECYPVMPVLRAHLELPENQGLVVAKVIPDSPAAKAGIEMHDILLAAGETKLTSIEDLVKTVEAAKETSLKIDILHAGKPKTVEITPAKRPQNAMYVQEGTPADWREIEGWMRRMQSGAAPDQPRQMRFRFIQPGAILPFNVPVQPPMPGNMSININRQNDQPAKISVTWNDKHWDITEKELDKLPAEVRPHVERMLGQGKFQGVNPGTGVSAEALDFTTPAPPPGMPALPPGISAAMGPQMQVQPFKALEDRLEELNRKIDAIQKELQKDRGDDQPLPTDENLTPETKPESPAAEEPAK